MTVQWARYTRDRWDGEVCFAVPFFVLDRWPAGGQRGGFSIRNRKKNALDPHEHAVQDIALRAMAKYNNVSELDFAKHFLSIKNEEDAQYALMRNVEGLRSEMDDFDDDNEEEN